MPDPSFREEMLALADELRYMPRDDFDWRPWDVIFRRRMWSGGAVGQGTATVSAFTLLPAPRCRQLTQREVDGSGGRYSDGDWKVEPITYRLYDLTGGYYPKPELSRPGTPTVTPQGTAGSTSWSYAVYARTGREACSDVSFAGLALGNATLSGSNFNRITWSSITGATSYVVFRVSAGGSPSTTGIIGTTTSTTFDDTGLSADGTAALPPCLQLEPRSAAEDRCWILQPRDAELPKECELVNINVDRVLRVSMVLRQKRHTYGV